MTHREPTPGTTRWIPALLVAGALVVAAAITAVGAPLLASRSSSATSSPLASSFSPPASPPVLPSEPPGALDEAGDATPEGAMVRRREHRDALGEADGLLPDGTTVSHAELPGVTNLDPDLLRALRKAARRAAKDGVELFVTSGWRSRAYQERLLDQAVAEYGSEEKAARWVASADTSPHVSGQAVDVGPFDAMAWLSKRGADYGLCQIYRNEPWHYELRPGAIQHGCPRMYANPTRDPRMQP